MIQRATLRRVSSAIGSALLGATLHASGCYDTESAHTSDGDEVKEGEAGISAESVRSEAADERLRQAGEGVPADVASGAADLPQDEEIAQASASERALEPERMNWASGDPQAGRAVYSANCVMCHGVNGDGQGQLAPGLNPKPRDFTSGEFYFDANANAETGEPVDLARVVREGPSAFGGSEAMPVWKKTLSDDQIRNVVAYVLDFANQDSGR